MYILLIYLSGCILAFTLLHIGNRLSVYDRALLTPLNFAIGLSFFSYFTALLILGAIITSIAEGNIKHAEINIVPKKIQKLYKKIKQKFEVV
jgi:hypothetical protein